MLPSPRNGIQLKTSVGVEGKLGERGRRLSERGGKGGGGEEKYEEAKRESKEEGKQYGGGRGVGYLTF